VSSQVFVYIMAAIIVAVVLFVGYRSVSTILAAAGKATIDTFKSDFSYAVEDASDSYGSRHKFEFTLPKKFDRICFVDSMNNGRFSINPDRIDNFYIRLSVEDDAEYNVFLLKEEKIEERFYVPSLDVLADYMCLDNQGLLEVWLEGVGDRACMVSATGSCLG